MMIRTALFVAVATFTVAACPPPAHARELAARVLSADAICWLEFVPGGLRHYCRDEGLLFVCEIPRERCWPDLTGVSGPFTRGGATPPAVYAAPANGRTLRR